MILDLCTSELCHNVPIYAPNYHVLMEPETRPCPGNRGKIDFVSETASGVRERKIRVKHSTLHDALRLCVLNVRCDKERDRK